MEGTEGRSLRQVTPCTEKGKEYRQEVIQRQVKEFHQAYDLWKQEARFSRTTLKGFCTEDQLQQGSQVMQNCCQKVAQCYEELLRNSAADMDIVKKRDTCDIITEEVLSVIENRFPVPSPTSFNEHLEKERVRGIINKKGHESVFGDSITETHVSKTSIPFRDSDSFISQTSTKKNAEAELAARKAEMEAMKEVQFQEEKLARMQADFKQQEALMHEQFVAETLKLQRMTAEKDYKVAEARVKAYSDEDFYLVQPENNTGGVLNVNVGSNQKTILPDSNNKNVTVDTNIYSDQSILLGKSNGGCIDNDSFGKVVSPDANNNVVTCSPEVSNRVVGLHASNQFASSDVTNQIVYSDANDKIVSCDADAKNVSVGISSSLVTPDANSKVVSFNVSNEAVSPHTSDNVVSSNAVNNCINSDVPLSDNVNFNVGNAIHTDVNHEGINPDMALFLRLRLPTPEPTVFTGDLLQYINWKTSFKALIENKGLSPAEKMFYLQRYLGGQAHKAVEGFFFVTSEESYKNAWNLLEERFGHPFHIQEAFREKLSSWPKIKGKDGVALQSFADFLRACKDAMTQVPGLQVLNDCKENQRLTTKLPEMLAARWNREVTQALEQRANYPSFAAFVGFVSKEARIACNPITSSSALRLSENADSPKRESSTSKAKGVTLATSAQQNQDTSNKEYSPGNFERICDYCKQHTHFLVKCPDFKKLSLADRKSFVYESRLCFGCLRKSHMSKDCQKRHTCMICKKKHPTLLHEKRESRVVKDNSNETTAVSFKVTGGEEHSTSMIVPVWLSSSDCSAKEVLTYAMLDNQSDSTFILEDLGKSVSDRYTPVKLKLTTMTSDSTILETNAVSDLIVRGLKANKGIKIPLSYTSNFIPADTSQIPTSDTAIKWPHLKHLASNIPALQDCKVGLLIGYNCPQALIPREIIAGIGDEPYAVKTDLGWSIVGHNNRTSKNSICNRVHVKELPQITPREVLSALQADFTDTQVGEKTVSQEDLHFLEIMEKSIKQEESGHYIMPLPFKSGMPLMPDNKKTALARLGGLKKKLQASPKYYEDYKRFMTEIIDKGDAEVVSEPPIEGHVWYIPHHGVYHPRKPNKIRVVFDCSAKYGPASLNSHLMTGPDLTNHLIGVLCRFREHPVAFMCDIEKMFHQFLVKEEHCDYLRFLWWEGSDVNNEVREYRMKVHLFGAASSPGCANFALKYHAKVNENESPETAQFIQENFYVDDGLQSCETEAEALNLIKDTKEVCKQGGLRLHKFISNSKEVMKYLDPSECSPGAKNVNLCEAKLSVERALGVQWQVETDTFTFSVQTKDYALTRRGILSAVASIYDPLGFIAPFILSGKTILQEMCQAGTSWDDPLPDKLLPMWERWKTDCSNLSKIKIARCFRPPDMKKVEGYELHHFSDGSTSGYGQCSYLRVISKEKVHCILIASKSRVAPTKLVTIPRLELTAAYVSALMSHTIKEELKLPIDTEYFWTDSQVVLSYINNDARRFHVFVANRLTKIHQLTETKQWHYVPSSENPADHASRGMSVSGLLTSNWFTGPQFLWDKSWKVDQETVCELNVGDPEVRKVTSLRTCTSNVSEFNIVDQLSSFSKWSSAIRAIARLHNTVRRLKNKEKLSSSAERQESEMFIIKSLQRKAFPEDIHSLTNKLNVKGTSPIYKLNPFLDETGVVRVGGRLKRGNISDHIKHPAIIPKISNVTNMLINHFHERTKHQGRGITLNEIRSSGYWIIGGTKAVQRVIHDCVICRKMRRPVEEQRMADLPEQRINPTPPFTYCGMDCFGPFVVKNKRKELKRYGLIITCLCCRGIHIEMLEDMSTDSLINALRCFIAIRGAVRQLRCDQGSNFIGARNELNESLKESGRIETFLAENQCEFVFNAPSSSHAGGIWERQIKTVRSILNATILLSSGRLDDASLRTFFYEAMAIVNGRPLSVESISNPLAPEPLTPNHLITMKSAVALPPPGKFVKEDLYIAKRWRRVQYLTEVFWGRWRKEYLLSLNERQKWNKVQRNMEVGDIVMLKEENVHRMEWPLAIVTETMASSDGLVRKVKVKLGSKKSVLERPVQKLVLLLESRN